MLRRSQGTLNLNEVHDNGSNPRRHTGGLRRLSRNFGIFSMATVEQAARNPDHLERLAKAADKKPEEAATKNKAAPAA